MEGQNFINFFLKFHFMPLFLINADTHMITLATFTSAGSQQTHNLITMETNLYKKRD